MNSSIKDVYRTRKYSDARRPACGKRCGIALLTAVQDAGAIIPAPDRFIPIIFLEFHESNIGPRCG